MLDAHQLNVFLTAAEHLNFTQAAKQLHMTQPSVSQHIQALERHFGTALFIRAGRHLELSDAGMALMPEARELVARAIRIEEMMESLKGEVYGYLHVGCSTTPGKYVLPQLLAEFHRDHPKVKISCQVSSQQESLQKLSEGKVHIALASAPHISAKNTEFTKFLVDPVILIAPLNHPWAAKKEIDADALYDASFILREANSGTRIAVQRGLQEIGIQENRLDVLLTLGNSEAIALAVQEGLGVGFVSSIIYTRLVEGTVAPIQVRGLKIERDIHIGRNIRRPATAAQQAFWELATSLDEKIRQGFLEGIFPEHTLS